MMENGGSLTTLSSFSMVHYTTMTGNVTFSQQQGTILQMKGSFTGSGNLNKSGAGVLVLSGNSPSYTGKMYLNEGALIVNSNFSNSGDPIVGEGTIFAGTGTVGDTDVFGTLKGGSPTQTGGDPIGTLNINGSLELETGSYFGTLISPSGHSLVAATGPVTIHPNTSYLVGLTPGLYTGSDIVVLTGSSITGTFENIVSNGSLASYFFTHNIAYTDTEVVFAITKKSIVPLASGQNAINVATALDDAIHFNRTEVTFDIEPGSLSADPTPELPEILFSLLPLSSDPTAMTYALNELHPAQLKGLAISQESNMVQIREALSQRMQNELDLTNCASHTQADIECARHKKTMTPWMSIIGESLAQNTENNSWGPLTGYRANMGGFGAGIDGRFSENFYAGAMTGYTHSHLLWKADKGHGNISSGYAGLYLSGLGKMFYGNASVIGGWSAYNTDRHIAYGFTDKIAKNSHGGSQILSHLDTGINWNYLDLTIRPFDSFDYISQTENSYTEHNAGEWNLHVKQNNEIMIRNELGLQLAKCFCVWNSKWTISPKLSWIYESRVKGDHFIVNFVDEGTPFFIEGYFPDRSLFAPGLVMTGMMLRDALAFNLYYNGEFGSGYSNNTYGGQVRYAF
jgi:autotransporter-associated beta strand protein